MPPQYPLVFGIVLVIAVIAYAMFKKKWFKISDLPTAWKYAKIYLIWCGAGFNLYWLYTLFTNI